MSERRRKIFKRIDAGDWLTDISVRFGVARSTVYNVKAFYDKTGDYKRHPSTGRPRTTCTTAVVEAIKEKVGANPCCLICQIAGDLKVDKSTISCVVRKDLGMKSRAVQKVQGWMAVQREKRLVRCKSLLNMMKKGSDKTLIFSNEKIFTINAVSNSRSLRYIARKPEVIPPEVRYMGRTKHLASAMMLRYIGADGKAFPPVWVKGSVNTAQYKNILAFKVFPVLDATYGHGKWVWTQDGAPAHTSRAMQAYLLKRLGLGRFWSKEVWPPNLPNLNPLDYHMWSAIERAACATHHSSVDAMKTSVEEHWAKIPTPKMNKVCSKFCSMVEACITAEGSIFEK